MALTCTDIGKLVHPYLDGEFSDEDRVALEQHTAECGACRELVQYEMAFKASMRAKLSPPKASSGLRRRVLASLDEVDRLQGGSEPRRLFAWLLPTSAMAAAAAATALFFLYPTAEQPARKPKANVAAARPVASVNDFVEDHRRAMPVSLRSVVEPPDQMDRELSDLERKMSYQLDVAVRLPRLSEAGAVPRAAWIVGLDGDNRDRKAGRVQYQLEDGDFSFYVFDPRNGRPNSGNTRRVGSADVLCDKTRGYKTCFFEKDGVGRVFVSGNLSEDELLRLITIDLRSR